MRCLQSLQQATTGNTPFGFDASSTATILIGRLISRMADPTLTTAGVIPWGSPVPSFGDPSSSLVATIGLNPSNREFVDENGNALHGHDRRFHTLSSLGIRSWQEATPTHCELIGESCRRYFVTNPYDTWFRKLDQVIGGTKASYYSGSACHLDLIPYATARKWTDLTARERVALLSHVGDTLGLLLAHSPVKVLVLNGRSVVSQFESISDRQLTRRTYPTWALPRRSESDVQGLGYEGIVESVAGVTLGRPILVLGFNHNIQSSFGVTREVTSAIAKWISRLSRRVLG